MCRRFRRTSAQVGAFRAETPSHRRSRHLTGRLPAVAERLRPAAKLTKPMARRTARTTTPRPKPGRVKFRPQV
jgi:hypothetical protein